MTKAIILAAGQGTRLLPYTKDLPKCMVEICGKSIIEHQIEIYKSCGIKNITLVGGYKIEKLKKYKLPIYNNLNYDRTNMLYSLFCAKALLEESHDLIISYGDILYSPKILRKLIESKKSISVVVDTNWKKYWEQRFDNIFDDAESLILKKDNQIAEIGSAANNLMNIQGQYIGLIKLNKIGKEIFLEIFKNNKDGVICGKEFNEAYMTDFIQTVINSNIPVNAILTKSPWIEIDNEMDLKSKFTIERTREILNDKKSNS